MIIYIFSLPYIWFIFSHKILHKTFQRSYRKTCKTMEKVLPSTAATLSSKWKFHNHLASKNTIYFLQKIKNSIGNGPIKFCHLDTWSCQSSTLRHFYSEWLPISSACLKFALKYHCFMIKYWLIKACWHICAFFENFLLSPPA